MNTFGYLLSVSACTGIFFSFYRFLLSSTTFFRWNRWYLIVSLAISFAIPLITLPVKNVEDRIFRGEFKVAEEKEAAVNVERDGVAVPVGPGRLTSIEIAEYAYFTVAVFLLLKLAVSAILLTIRLKRCELVQTGGKMIRKSGGGLGNGSFWGYIFIDPHRLTSAGAATVVRHELVHTELVHSADKLFAGVVQAVLWFNPFSYLYSRAISENHEFEVDQVLTKNAGKAEYAELILSLGTGVRSMLYNEFSMPAMKKRVTLLFKKPSDNMKKLIYLLIIPITLLSCFAFSAKKNKQAEEQKFSMPQVKLNAPASGQIAPSNVIVPGTVEKDSVPGVKRTDTPKQVIKTGGMEGEDRDTALTIRYTAADSIKFNRDGKVINLYGQANIHIAKGTSSISITGEKAVINRNTMTVSAQGDAYDPERKITTGKATLTLQPGEGYFNGVRTGGKGSPHGTADVDGARTLKADTIYLNIKTLKGKGYGASDDK